MHKRIAPFSWRLPKAKQQNVTAWTFGALAIAETLNPRFWPPESRCLVKSGSLRAAKASPCQRIFESASGSPNAAHFKPQVDADGDPPLPGKNYKDAKGLLMLPLIASMQVARKPFRPVDGRAF
jgi:hypothetical protein